MTTGFLILGFVLGACFGAGCVLTWQQRAREDE